MIGKNTLANADIPNEFWKLWQSAGKEVMSPVSQDFGVFQLGAPEVLWQTANVEAIDLVVTSQVWLSAGGETVPDDIILAMAALCKDVGVGLSDSELGSVLRLRPGQRFFLAWRSRVSPFHSRFVRSFLDDVGRQMLCAQQWSVKADDALLLDFVTHADPFPDGGTVENFLGAYTTSVISSTVQMLIGRDPTVIKKDQPWRIFNIQAGGNFPAVAFEPGPISAQVSFAPGRDACPSIAMRTVADVSPGHVVAGLHVQGSGAYRLVGFHVGAVCPAVGYEMLQDNLGLLEMACSDLQRYPDLPEGCSLQAYFQHRDDPGYYRAMEVSWPKVAEQPRLDRTSARGSLALLPRQQDNPAYLGKLWMAGEISSQQRFLIERALDLWAFIDKDSFLQLIIPMKKIRRADPTQCGDGIRAYVDSAAADTIFLCNSAGIGMDDRQKSVSYEHLVALMTTLIHESLHLAGKVHDKEMNSSEGCTPAAGTSFTAAILHKLHQCQDYPCRGLLKQLPDVFRSEMLYNFQAQDPRLTAGVCRQISQEVGVSFD